MQNYALIIKSKINELIFYQMLRFLLNFVTKL